MTGHSKCTVNKFELSRTRWTKAIKCVFSLRIESPKIKYSWSRVFEHPLKNIYIVQHLFPICWWEIFLLNIVTSIKKYFYDDKRDRRIEWIFHVISNCCCCCLMEKRVAFIKYENVQFTSRSTNVIDTMTIATAPAPAEKKNFTGKIDLMGKLRELLRYIKPIYVVVRLHIPKWTKEREREKRKLWYSQFYSHLILYHRTKDLLL